MLLHCRVVKKSFVFFFAAILETDEQDIIARFVRTDKTLVTWETLSTVFRLWAIGMAAAGICFAFERLIHFYF